MKTVLSLDYEDINTSPLGNNFVISVKDDLMISLTKQAAEELYLDLRQWIKNYEVETDSQTD